MPHLEYTNGDDQAQRLDLTPELTSKAVLIGSGVKGALTVKAPGVVAKHFQIDKSGGDGEDEEAFWLTDLGSKSGTWLNGTRLERKTRLHSGDVIHMADVELRFVEDMDESGRLATQEAELQNELKNAQLKVKEIQESLRGVRRKKSTQNKPGSGRGELAKSDVSDMEATPKVRQVSLETFERLPDSPPKPSPGLRKVPLWAVPTMAQAGFFVGIVGLSLFACGMLLTLPTMENAAATEPDESFESEPTPAFRHPRNPQPRTTRNTSRKSLPKNTMKPKVQRAKGSDYGVQSRPLVNQLNQAISSGDKHRIDEAFRALVEFGKTGLGELGGVYRQTNSIELKQKIQDAIHAILGSQNPEDLVVLIEKSKDYTVRNFAVRELTQRKNLDPDFLRGVIDSGNGLAVRKAALNALVRNQNSRSIKTLADIARNTTDRQIKIESVRLLGQNRTSEARSVILDVARSGTDPSLRQTAIVALGNFRGQPEVVNVLSDLLQSTNGTNVQDKVILSLGKVGGPEQLEALERIKSTVTDPKVKWRTEQAIKRIKTRNN